MSPAGQTLPEGYRLLHHDRIGSTNDEAKRLARAGAGHGTIVWADEQTAGRGRRGRLWVSPPGNLYLSLLLRPQISPPRGAQLGFVTALGLADAVTALTGPTLQLRCKWPNDLLANGRKVAGILLESEMSASESIDFIVIGVGANLAARPDNVEFPATSLSDEGFARITPAVLLEGFVVHFDRWAQLWRSEGFEPVRAAWLARAAGLGDVIRVRLEQRTFLGRFVDLDQDGALLVETAKGRLRVAAGEVFPVQSAAGADGRREDRAPLSPVPETGDR